MSDDFVSKMYETLAEFIARKQELSETKQELERIRKEHEKLKNEVAVNNLMKTDEKFSYIEELITVSDTQSATVKNDLASLSVRGTRTILLLGGYDGNKELNTLLILENNGQNWKELNMKLPYGIWSHGAQFLDNNLYIFGGQNAEDILNFTYKLSKGLQWEQMADMSERRSSILNSSVALNDQIWVLGGYNGNENLSSVEMYDPQTNEWKFMRQMNEGRAGAAAVVVNGKIFCSGGYRLNSVEYYDPSSDIWTLICNIPQEIWGHGAVEMDGNFILMGGFNYSNYLNKAWTLDTTDKNTAWIEKPPMNISRMDFSIAKIDGKIYVCGGENKKDSKFKDNVEIFDGKVWRNGPKMNTPQSDAAAVVIPIEFAQCLK